MTTPAPTSYSAATWYDDAEGGTPIDADALNRIENGIAGAYQFAGQIYLTPVTTGGNFTASVGQLVEVTLTSANATVTLPTAYVGAYVAVKKMDNTSYVVNLATTNSQTIDNMAPGSAAVRLNNECRIYQGTANGWIVIAGVNTISALDAHYDARYLPLSYGFHMTLGATFATSTANGTPTNWSVNTNNGFTYSAGTVTVPTTMPISNNWRWRVHYHGSFSSVAGQKILQMNRNSATLGTANTIAIAVEPASTSVDGDIFDCIYQGALNPGDVLRFWAYSNGAANLTYNSIITAAPFDTWVDIVPVGLA